MNKSRSFGTGSLRYHARMLSPETNFVPTHELDHIVDKLRRPDATLGWSGDHLLTIGFNRIRDVWEVHRERPDGSGKYDFVCRQKEPGERLDVTKVIRGLVARDTTIRGNSALEQAKERQKANDENEIRLAQEAAESEADMKKRLTFELMKATGAGHIAPITVPEKTWES
jgi:hypothetical protein